MRAAVLGISVFFGASGTRALAVRSEPLVALPRSMASIGDSISSAAFGKFSRSDATEAPWREIAYWDSLARYMLQGQHPSAIENKEFSWTTNLDPRSPVTSHAKKLRFLNEHFGHHDFIAENFAVTGAMTRGVLEIQLEQLKKWSRSHLAAEAPEYVTILSGANDICATHTEEMTPTSEYIADYASITDEILKSNPKTKILVVAIPRIDLLRSTIGPAPYNDGAWLKTCQEQWNLTKECHRITLERDPLKQAQISARVREYYDATAELVRSRATEHGDRIRLAKTPYEMRFTPDDVSLDCFHPSPEGQSRISRYTWGESWWANGWGDTLEDTPTQD